jgi:hypothetical protein
MSNGGPLINIGELAKPASILVEKICDGIAGIARPYHIIRIAKAEAEAHKIETLAQIEIDEIQARAIRRFIAEENNKQLNIEDIINKAIPELNSDSRPNEIENDWITNFIDKCKLISDDEMQTLWSKVLAGEANSPGKYSKRTINFLATMDKEDANAFSLLCRYIWNFEENDFQPFIMNLHDDIYDKEGLTFDVIKHLQDIGLILYSNMERYNKQRIPKNITISYNNLYFEIELPKPIDNIVDVGHVLLSKVGSELATLAGNIPLNGFADYIVKHFISNGYVVSSK